MRGIVLLVTVATCLSRTAVADEDVTQIDRIIVECSQHWMDIHLRRDFERFSLEGNEPECKPVARNFTEYDGTVIPVMTWSLPLNEHASGPCGLHFGPLDDSELWVHSTTILGPDHPRIAQCIKPGVLDKRASRIRVEQITPKMKELIQNRGTIEVANGSTISASFHHRFPQAAALSLHPLTCWMINERRESRQLVVDGGCPVKDHKGRAIVSLGSETASMATGDHPHVFFNAEPSLFENEDPSDFPSFRLQCSVIPCKGAHLHQQVIGVARCPSIAWCDNETDEKKMTYRPADAFEVNQEFSLKISKWYSVPAHLHRELGLPIYPGGYMAMDTIQREHPEEEGLSLECAALIGLLVVFIIVLILAVCAIRRLMKNVVCKEELRMCLRGVVHPKGKVSDDRHPMKTSEPLFVDEQGFEI